jgi:hypothetical protein
MKVILRNTINDLYVLDENRWTHDPGKARDFQRADAALQAARESGLLNDLELMVSLNGIHFDIRQPCR